MLENGIWKLDDRGTQRTDGLNLCVKKAKRTSRGF